MSAAAATPVQDLQARCERALDSYVHEARKTCYLMATLPMYSITAEQCRELSQQIQRESLAQTAYVTARGAIVEGRGISSTL